MSTTSTFPPIQTDRVTPPLHMVDPTAPSSTPAMSRGDAVKAAIAAAPERGILPAGAPGEEMVLTPGGMRPKSHVHSVPVGGRVAHVGNEVHLLDASGAVMHKSVPGDTIPRLPQESGWVSYASWFQSHTPPIKEFLTNWTVPPNPAANNGQTIFLFNSIEPASFNAIMQPVLQWGPSYAGGGPYWSVATWYLVGSQVYVTPLTNVSVGQELQGVIVLEQTNADGTYNYSSWFAVTPNSGLGISNAAQLVWATETLESYGTVGPSSYPTGSTQFNSIYIWLTNGVYPTFSWQAVSDPGDGITTTVNQNGAYNAAITITY